MEEDIKILEELINNYRDCGIGDFPESVIEFGLNKKEVKAIINLIAKNKQKESLIKNIKGQLENLVKEKNKQITIQKEELENINIKIKENEKIIIEDLKKYIEFAKKEENFETKAEHNFHIELSDRVKSLLNLYEKELARNKELEELLEEDNNKKAKIKMNITKISKHIPTLDFDEEENKNDI